MALFGLLPKPTVAVAPVGPVPTPAMTKTGTRVPKSKFSTKAHSSPAVGFGDSPNSATPHRIYEFSIPLTLISAMPGQSIDFSSPALGFKPVSMPYDPATGHDNVWPLGLVYDPSGILGEDTWGILSLSSGVPVGGVLEPLNKAAILAPYLSLITLLGTIAAAMTAKKRRI